MGRRRAAPRTGPGGGVISGTALLSGKWALVVVLVAYLARLGMQIYLEERELSARFGPTYVRYGSVRVPRDLSRVVEDLFVVLFPAFATGLTRAQRDR